MSADAAPERYQFKIVLRHVSPMVWRRVVVPSALTLADLHEVIQMAMGWDDEHLHRFHVHGRDHALSRPSVAGCGDPRGTRLVDLRLRIGERFTYEYNFHGPWMHDLRLEAKLPPDSRWPWPVCTAGHQACPPEHCCGPVDYREWLDGHFSLDAMMELTDAQDVVVTIIRWKLEDDQPLTDDE